MKVETTIPLLQQTVSATEAGGINNGTAGIQPSGNVLANDTDVDATAAGETKTVTGVLAGTSSAASGSVGTSVAGNYGSIVIQSNGSYTCTVDNSNVTVQALRPRPKRSTMSLPTR
ncbi:MAG: VCBS domain-containing protein [Pirellulales bacterium]